jgi:hypothetical protein
VLIVEEGEIPNTLSSDTKTCVAMGQEGEFFKEREEGSFIDLSY